MAGLGFMVDESPAFKGKQGAGVFETFADAYPDAAQGMANVGKRIGKGILAGAALPIAAAMDVSNKVGNAVSSITGNGQPFSTDNTQRLLNWGGGVEDASTPPGAQTPPAMRQAATPVPAIVSPPASGQQPTAAPDAGAYLATVPAPARAVQPITGQQSSPNANQIPNGGTLEMWDQNNPSQKTVYQIPGIATQPAPLQLTPDMPEYHLQRMDPTIAGIVPLRAQRLANDAALGYRKTNIDQGKLDLERQELPARMSLQNAQADLAGAHTRYFNAMSNPEYLTRQLQIAQLKDAAERDKEQTKLDANVLQNGFQVAPTPQALQGYRSWQGRLNAWDRQVSPYVGALDKSYGSNDAGKIRDAITAYNKNPADQIALRKVADARDILTGGGQGALPAWFDQALSMPRFDTSGLQPWKQPQMIANPGE